MAIATPGGWDGSQRSHGSCDRGQRAFGFKEEKQVEGYWSALIGSATKAGQSIREFTDIASDIEGIGTMWADSAANVVAATDSVVDSMGDVSKTPQAVVQLHAPGYDAAWKAGLREDSDPAGCRIWWRRRHGIHPNAAGDG